MKRVKFFSMLFVLGVITIFTGPGMQAEWRMIYQNPSETIFDICFADSDHGWATSWGGGIFHTQDEGKTWEEQESGLKYEWMNAVDFIDRSTGWIAGGDGTILKTTDGGNQWAAKTYLLKGNDLLGLSPEQAFKLVRTSEAEGDIKNLGFEDIEFWNEKEGVAVGSRGIILKTRDGGGNWFSVKIPTEELMMEVHFADENTGYAVGTKGVVIKTTDGGSNWEALDSGTKELLYAVWFVDPDIGCIAGRSAAILRTTDGGKNWFRTFQGTDEEVTDMYFTDEKNGWAVGGSVEKNQFILRTTDAGNSWNKQKYDKRNWWHSVWFTDDETGYIGGNRGVMIKTEDAGE